MVCPMPEFLGTWLDLDRNEANAAVISIPEIRVTVRVMRTEEEIRLRNRSADCWQSIHTS